MAANSFTPLRCNFVKILLNEANGDMSPLDIPALENLMNLCIKGDIQAIEVIAHHSNCSRAAGAARFILRKHQFHADHARNVEIMKAQINQPWPTEVAA